MIVLLCKWDKRDHSFSYVCIYLFVHSEVYAFAVSFANTPTSIKQTLITSP